MQYYGYVTDGNNNGEPHLESLICGTTNTYLYRNEKGLQMVPVNQIKFLSLEEFCKAKCMTVEEYKASKARPKRGKKKVESAPEPQPSESQPTVLMRYRCNIMPEDAPIPQCSASRDPIPLSTKPSLPPPANTPPASILPSISILPTPTGNPVKPPSLLPSILPTREEASPANPSVLPPIPKASATNALPTNNAELPFLPPPPTQPNLSILPKSPSNPVHLIPPPTLNNNIKQQGKTMHIASNELHNAASDPVDLDKMKNSLNTLPSLEYLQPLPF